MCVEHCVTTFMGLRDKNISMLCDVYIVYIYIYIATFLYYISVSLIWLYRVAYRVLCTCEVLNFVTKGLSMSEIVWDLLNHGDVFVVHMCVERVRLQVCRSPRFGSAV